MSLPQDDRLATIEEAAEFWHSSVNALRVQRFRNMRPGNLGVKVGAKLLYSPNSMRSWFSDQEQAQNSDAN